MICDSDLSPFLSDFDLIIENKGDPTKFLTIPSFSIPVDTWPVFTGLPTGHGLGTMEKRFDEENSPGRGVVRAKTGTLNQVITLAGTITTKDNAFLSFAILVNRVEKPTMVREEGRILTKKMFLQSNCVHF